MILKLRNRYLFKGIYVIISTIILFSSCYTIKDIKNNSNGIINNSIVLDKNNNLLINQNELGILKNSYANIEELTIPQINSPIYFWKIVKFAPKFDSLNIIASAKNINNYITTQGYFNNEVNYNIIKKIIKNDTFYLINYIINFKNPYHINNITYNLNNEVKKLLVKQNIEKKYQLLYGDIFTYDALEEELNNIVQAHKELGYYNIKSNDFKIELDTLINQFSTKFKYVNISFNYINNIDSNKNKLKQFIIKDIHFITNSEFSNDTSKIENIEFDTFKNIHFQKNYNIIKPKILWLFNTLNKGEYFTESSYKQNLNNLYNLSVWDVINVNPSITKDTLINNKEIGQINFKYLLERKPKYNIGSDLSLGFNSIYPFTAQSITFINQNSWGISLNGFFNIHNTYKKAIETKITARASIESFINTTSTLFGTYDIGLDFSQFIPWFVPFNLYKTKNSLLQSSYNIGIGFTKRIDFYNLKNINTSFAWRFDNKKLNLFIEYKPLYLSLVFLNKEQRFLYSESLNPYLKYAFSNGLTAGMSLTINKNFIYTNFKKHTSFFQLYLEESGSTWAYPININNNYPVYKYIKILGTLTHQIVINKSSLNFRLKAGYGFSYGDDTINNKTLPFFKQFFVGGPNSLRAWDNARLGIGSSTSTDTTDFKDRYGDIALESNFEYRFNILKYLNTFKIESVLFIDIGNIWNRIAVANEDDKSVFAFNKIYNDLAISTGTGLRLVFGFLVIRLDVAWKYKNPILPTTKQILNIKDLNFTTANFQFGVGYPF